MSEDAAHKMSLCIRDATPDDLAEIETLETAIFGADAWSRAMIADELMADHRAYLALHDREGRIIGYGGVMVVGAEGDVQTLAVDQEYRGHGHGARLLRELLDRARQLGARDIFLEVRADNPGARSMYAGFGFQEIAVRPNYYQPDGVDAIVMRLSGGVQ